MLRCKAKTSASHYTEQCRSWAMHQKEVCYKHGGKTPQGRALPQTTHGRYSKDLPARLAGKYEEAIANPELLSIRGEVAVIEARFRELLGRVQAGDLGTLWTDLARAKRAFTEASQAQDTAGMATALRAMEALIDRGAQDWHLWETIGKEAERLARLRQAEHKRLVDMEQLMSAEQANMLLGVIVSLLMAALQEHIPDGGLVRRIYGSFSRGLATHLDTTTPRPVVARLTGTAE